MLFSWPTTWKRYLLAPLTVTGTGIKSVAVKIPPSFPLNSNLKVESLPAKSATVVKEIGVGASISNFSLGNVVPTFSIPEIILIDTIVS